MLEALRVIADFVIGLVKGAANLLPVFIDSVTLVSGAIGTAPPFLFHIMSLMLSVCVIMWVVNIL